MGKATIRADRSKGKWGVNYKYAYANSQARIDDITLRLSEIAVEIVAKFTEMDNAETEYNYSVLAKNASITVMIACQNTPGCDIDPKNDDVREKTKESIELYGSFIKLKIEYNAMRSIELSLIKEKAFIQNYTNKEELTDLWCVDTSYLIDLDVDAVTVELFNNKKHGVVLLPYDTSYNCDDHGLMSGVYNLKPPGTDTAVAHIDHYAMELANTNWQSHYVYGEILEIDRVANTGVVRISGVGPYPNSYTINGAIFDYMECDNEVFNIGDSAVLELDWSSTTDGTDPDGTIIGFLNNPKACPIVSGLADPLKPNQKTSENELSHFYAKDGIAWENNKKLGTVADSLIDKMAGKYSGEMRKIVQDAYSRGTIPPYDYGWAKTHGIFVTGNGKRWVIEIASSGIRAWPLIMVGVVDDSVLLDSLSYIPKLSPDPNDGTVIEITVAGLVDVYNYAPFFSGCGWAFSQDGHNAANVVYEDRTTTDNPATGGLSYAYSYLYEVDIIETDDAPYSATVTLIESDWLYGDRNTHFKFPNYGQNSLFSFDWFRGHPTPPWTAGSETGLTAPIHCWYEDNVLEVVRYRNASGVSSQPYISNPVVPSPDATTNPGPVDTTPWGDLAVTTDAYNCFSSPIHAEYAESSESGDKNQWVEVDSYDWLRLDSSGWPFFLGVGLWAKEISVGIDSTDSVFHDNIIITLNDRESVGHYRSTKITESISSLSRTDSLLWYDGTGSIRQVGQGGAPVGTSTNPASSSSNRHTVCQGFQPIAIIADGRYDVHSSFVDTDSRSFANSYTGNSRSTDIYYADNGSDCDTYKTDLTEAAIAYVDRVYPDNTFISVSLDSGSPESDGSMWYDVLSQRPDLGITTSNKAIIRIGPEVDYSPSFTYSTSGNLAASSVTVPDIDTEDVEVYIGSAAIALPIVDGETSAEWSYYVSDLNTQYQWFLGAVDMSGNVDPIYMDQPVSSRSTWSFDDQVVVPAPYPNPSKIFPSWVGNP